MANDRGGRSLSKLYSYGILINSPRNARPVSAVIAYLCAHEPSGIVLSTTTITVRHPVPEHAVSKSWRTYQSVDSKAPKEGRLSIPPNPMQDKISSPMNINEIRGWSRSEK